MSKDNKEDSGYGFKDKAKAEETLRLLEEHDIAYRKLTVRGLLGRAKRVLTLTKAEEKLNNIKAAMEVFETWLAENGVDTSKKAAKKTADSSGDGEKKAETVPGLGFKDKERALETLKVLEGRDPDYQKLAIKGLIGSAKRVLPSTKDESKINNINEALEVFNKFLDDFDAKNMSKQTLAYLPYETVKVFLPLAAKYGVNVEPVSQFLEDYEKVENYKHLRTIKQPDTEISWDIVRNKELKKLTDTFEAEYPNLFEDNKDPSEIHVKMILWGYSPNAGRIKTLATQLAGSGEEKRGTKRKSGGDSDEDESPRKK